LKIIIGTPIGISQPVLGVIKAKKKILQKSLSQIGIFKKKDSNLKPCFYVSAQNEIDVYLVTESNRFYSVIKNNPHVSISLKDFSNIREGDIVLIEPNGTIKFFYEIESTHNSIFITNRCNCHCIMCPQPPGEDNINHLERNLWLISQFDKKKTTRLGITGGEPTVIGDDLITVIMDCRKHLPNTYIDLLTNGRNFKNLKYAKALVKAGLPYMTVEIPLYADNDIEHDRIMGVKGSFYDTLHGLHNLALLGQPVALRTVLHSMTLGRLLEYSEFVYRNFPFVTQVAFMGMETTGLAKKNLNRLWVDPYDYTRELSAAVRYLHRRLIPVSIYNHQLCILPRNLWQFAKRSISQWKVVYPETCQPCSIKEECGGIFGTGERHSAYLHPI
jgi:His-Xaa-Ser system radical SAM maturase HxsC